MQNSLRNKLIERGCEINCNKLNISPQGIDISHIDRTEIALDIVIPNDMKYIYEKISCDLLGTFEFFDFTVDEDDWNGIIKIILNLERNSQSIQKTNQTCLIYWC